MFSIRDPYKGNNIKEKFKKRFLAFPFNKTWKPIKEIINFVKISIVFMLFKVLIYKSLLFCTG